MKPNPNCTVCDGEGMVEEFSSAANTGSEIFAPCYDCFPTEANFGTLLAVDYEGDTLTAITATKPIPSGRFIPNNATVEERLAFAIETIRGIDRVTIEVALDAAGL